MEHGASLITTLASAFGLALVMGFLAARVKLPPLVGYLVAGIIIGPYTRGFTADVALAGQLAEIGVMLLMFGVGLHFSFADLVAVKGIAVPGAIAQIAISTALGTAAAMLWGWGFAAGLVFGLALSVASTVVLLRALEARGQFATFNGRIAVGWLIVQDLVMVLILVLLPALADGHGAGKSLLLTLAKVGTFIVLMLVVGRRLFPRVLWLVARTGSRELFTLCVIAAAVGVAYGAAALFGVSFALGAFFAGMLLGESSLSHRAADESLPLRDAFAVLFFVSVGMLFDPSVVVREPLGVLAVLGIVMIGNPLAAMILVVLFRYPLNTAVTIGVSLAQIGEFSFILAELGRKHQLLPVEGQNLILAGAILSIALNPALFAAIAPAQRWMRERSHLARRLELRADPLAELPMSVDPAELTGHVAIVGYGRVGRRVAQALAEQKIPFTIAEENRELVEKLRGLNMRAVSGNASDPAVLIQAHVARAAMLVIATPDTVDVRKMVDVARQLNPKIDIVLRTHSDEVAELLRGENLGTVFMGEHELARAITRHVVERMTKEIEEPV
ncbi:MAG TPA: cation:proton antiporter [Thermoanaerobaculia bacterium]